MPSETDPIQVDNKPSKLGNLKLFLSKFNLKKILGVGFILVLIIALGYIIYSHIKEQPAQTSQTINLQELRKIITPEIKQCLLNKLGNSEAKRLVEEAKQSKEIPPEAMSAIRSCVPASLLARVFPSNTSTPPSAPGVQTVPSSGIALGVYEPPSNQDPLSYGQAVDQYKQEVRKYPAYEWISVKWENGNNGQYNQFNSAVPDQFRTRGIMPAFNWDPSKGEALKNTNQPDFSWQSIAGGRHDAYITQFAKDIATYHYPILIRPFAEMDGDYYPWGYHTNGNNNPADFVKAWKHVVDIYRKVGATNVQFVWCQSSLQQDLIDKGNNRNILKQLYPGDDYVDYLALDGYASAKNNWRSVSDEFGPSYQLLTSFSTRPMIFFEIGTSENPNDPTAKANWITQGFLTTIPTQFPAVKAVSWMDAKNSFINPGTTNDADWAVDTSQNSLNAWKQVVASPLYQGSLLK